MEEDPSRPRRSERPQAPAARPGERASVPPSGALRPARHLRIAFAALWIGLQLVLVLTASRRSDGAFGFRMFSESTTMKLVLYREVESGKRIHVDAGAWTARSADGRLHDLTWYDRVPSPFWVFDREMSASYGAAAQLSRLQAALDDVATHVPSDAETRRFVLEVTIRRNGRDPVVQRLVSVERTTSRAGLAVDAAGPGERLLTDGGL